MDYGLESSSSSSSIEQTPDISEEISDSEYESVKLSENFDDCGTDEVSEVDTTEIETAEFTDEISENYDDCEIDEVSEPPEIDEAKAEEYDDFDDCGVESLEITEEESETEPEVSEEDIKIEAEVTEEELDENAEELEEQTDEYKEAKSEFLTAKEMRDENAERIEDLAAKKNNLEKEAAEKFDAVTKEERGTEEYKSALKELNDTQDKQTEIESQLQDAQKQQEDLERKTIELRDAQIKKGNEAVELSSISIEKTDALQERFDSQIYGDRIDVKELSKLQNDNSRMISELSAERNSVHLAMDAKMSEIRDYVYANNLERFDTERDLYYQKLISEYRSLDEVYHRLDYNVVKLDENNIQISEISGEKYESVRFKTGSQIEEVRQGTDIPGDTNYFVNEIKAREVLSSFRQSQWENLSVKEQKSAIENLANYNASILGIDNPPVIMYYRSDDVTDYGVFSESQHTIYINENNLRNAVETADTISHEYRHCYQHERAEKLENERDLEFRESFENYVSPENDYARYRDQLVERDAREYADEVRKEIAKLENDQIQDALDASVEEGDAIAFETLNPEKGAVFEKITSDQLPENFAKKIVEIKEYKEIFETAELQEIKDRVAPAYENGAEIANRIEEFNTYKEHHEIDGGHIGKVHDKSLQAADVLEEAFGNNSYNGLYSSNIDRKSLEMMALYHDTGMDGNVSADKFDEAKQDYLSTPGCREEYVQNLINKKPKISVEEANSKYEKEAFESQFRKEHSVQSAIHALRDREFIEGHGADADRVALGCLAHSKSHSGVGNLADTDLWNDAIGKLDNAVAEFNRTHPDEQIDFNDSFLRGMEGKFDNENLAEMRSEVFCLRIGDANGHDSKSRTSQNGKEISFSLDDWKKVQNKLSEDLRNKIESGDCNNFLSEVQNANVEINGVRLENSDDTTGFSRMFAVGEGNFKNVDLEMVDGIPTQKFELENGDAYPMSTQYCILERLKEYNTAKIDPQMAIERKPGMSDKDYEKYVQAQLDSMPKVDFVAEINIGSSDDRTTRVSYEAFADKVHTDYGINVRIVPEEVHDSIDKKDMKNDAAKIV